MLCPSPGSNRAARGLLLVVTTSLLLSAICVGVDPPTRSGSLAAVASDAPIAPSSIPPAGPAPATGGVGSVLAVDNVLTDQVTPGTSLPLLQEAPAAGVFDASNGDLYVRGSSGETLSVVNGTSDLEIATIAVGADPVPNPQVPTVAVDPRNGQVYVTNYGPGNVSVINGTTEKVVASLSLPREPYGIVSDPTTGDLFVSDYSDANVSVISGSADRVIKNITVGSRPGAIAYDPTDARLFVANYGSSNVTVIDAVTEKVVGNWATGAEPVALAWDPADDYLDVANYLGHDVSIFSGSSGTLLWTTPLGTAYPVDLAYSSAGDRMFVVNFDPTNVTIIDQSPYQSGGNLLLPGAPQWVAFDPANDRMFVACPQAVTVSILDTSTDSFVKNLTIPDLPSAVAVDPANGQAFVIDEGTSSVEANVTVIDPTTDRSVANIPLGSNLGGITYDPSLSALEVTDLYGNSTYQLGGATGLVERLDHVGDEPIVSAYDPANGDLYVVNQAGTNVTILDSSGAVAGSLATGGLVTGVAVDPALGLLYASTDGGNVTVIDLAHPANRASIVVTAFDLLKGIIYDPHSNEVYVAGWAASNLTVIDPLTNKTVGPSIPVGTEPAAMLGDPANGTLFVANDGSGNISVLDDSTNRVVRTLSSPGVTTLTYDAATDSIYSTGTYHPEVNAYDATTYASLGTPLVLGNLNVGGIAYDPADQRVFVSDEYGGALFEIGPASSGPPQFAVTFSELGLAPGTSWSISLESSGRNTSITSDIGFSKPNGTYTFTIGAVPGYTPTTLPGSVDVQGAPVAKEIDFFANVTVALASNASSIRLGNSVTLTTTVTGGTTPFEYVYTLPAGCESANSSSLTCAPTSLGDFGPSVEVTDSQGQVRSASTTFTVIAAFTPPVISVLPTSVDLGQNATLSTTSPIGGGGSPYTCQWLLQEPGGSFVALGEPFTVDCTTIGLPTVSTGVLGATGAWSFELEVTDHAGIVEASNVVTVSVVTKSAPASGLPTWEWVVPLVAVILAAFPTLAWAMTRRRKKDTGASPATGTPGGPAAPAPGSGDPPRPPPS